MATTDQDAIIWFKEEDLLSLVATGREVQISKTWIDKTTKKTIAMEPIEAMALVFYAQQAGTFWDEVKGQTNGLLSNKHLARSLVWPELNLTHGLSVQSLIVEEKAGKKPEAERRLFINTYLKDNRKAFGNTMISFTSKELSWLATWLRKLAYFLSDYRNQTRHRMKPDHDLVTCAICKAVDYGPIRTKVIDLVWNPQTADEVAESISDTLAEFYKTQEGIPIGELRLEIRGEMTPLRKGEDPPGFQTSPKETELKPSSTDYHPLTQQELPCFDGVSDDPETNAMIRRNQEDYIRRMVKKFRNSDGKAVCPPSGSTAAPVADPAPAAAPALTTTSAEKMEKLLQRMLASELGNSEESNHAFDKSPFYPDGISPANGQAHLLAQLAQQLQQQP